MPFVATTALTEFWAKCKGTFTTLDSVYPVGSIYMSVNSTDPGTLFGGRWQQIQDMFLLAAGTSHAAGSTGGEETVQLSESETPVHAHTHSMTQPAFTLPNHVHETANSMVVYNASGTQRMATSGSGTKISLNSSLDNNLNTYNPTTNPACTRSTNAAVNARAYPSGESESTVDAHNNMPPYLAVYVWQRTA